MEDYYASYNSRPALSSHDSTRHFPVPGLSDTNTHYLGSSWDEQYRHQCEMHSYNEGITQSGQRHNAGSSLINHSFDRGKSSIRGRGQSRSSGHSLVRGESSGFSTDYDRNHSWGHSSGHSQSLAMTYSSGQGQYDRRSQRSSSHRNHRSGHGQGLYSGASHNLGQSSSHRNHHESGHHQGLFPGASHSASFNLGQSSSHSLQNGLQRPDLHPTSSSDGLYSRGSLSNCSEFSSLSESELRYGQSERCRIEHHTSVKKKKGRGSSNSDDRYQRHDESVHVNHFDKKASSNRGARESFSSRGGSKQNLPCMTQNDLQAQSQASPEDLVAYVCHNERDFLNSFLNDRYCSHPRSLKYLIAMLSSLASNDDVSYTAMKLAQIFSSDGKNTFITAIEALLKEMSSNDRYRDENIQCLKHLVKIGESSIMSIPSTVLYCFPLAYLQQATKDLVRRSKIAGFSQKSVSDLCYISTNLEALNELFDIEKMKYESSKLTKKATVKTTVSEPPELFTELPVLPTSDELTITSDDVYLRPNIVSGKYKSWEHYFDIQFRLLREDFIRPLRDGINNYHYYGSTKNGSEIRVYKNVKILQPECLFSGIGFEIQFELPNMQKINWEHSKRLIFGSLLCLSNDNFSHSIVFATVMKRDPESLKNGLVTVKFENNANPMASDPNTVFEMVESTAYFEAYRYILQRLQSLSKSPDLMPMKKYIVDCDYEEVNCPAFVSLSDTLYFDLSSIVSETPARHFSRRRLAFDIKDESSWPDCRATSLNNSQLEALKAALTQEMAVIQGPPGTGKTFMGLKIAETYLKNRQAWDPSKSSPILVVCFTNHALDQFLEGIKRIRGLDGTNIIRIGGRSKSNELSDCQLQKKIEKVREARSLPKKLLNSFRDARAEMLAQQKIIMTKMKNCDAVEKNKVLSLSDLSGCISRRHQHQLLQEAYEEDREIEIWLGLWFSEDLQDFPAAEGKEVEYEETNLSEDSKLEVVEKDVSGDNEEQDILIEVDTEAQNLEDDRLIDGEKIALPEYIFDPKTTPKVRKRVSSKSRNGWTVIQQKREKRERLIKKGFQNIAMTQREEESVRDIWKLSVKDKWKLYLRWIDVHIKNCRSRISDTIEGYNRACALYSSAQHDIDIFVAQKADVIGMTTTGAAKYHHLLDSLHPKIAIFEEAAEVLEAHLVTSLTSSIQQVILIGDHKQLRPKPTCYHLEVKYNLGISLFERLITPNSVSDSEEEVDCISFFGRRCPRKQNKALSCVSLEIQHRMRPEISRLICPSIYDKLCDAEQVKDYDNVKGISKNLFFISHAHKEEENTPGDSRSHVNKYEADYAVKLCSYLLKQGYSHDEITILTLYSGQLLELKSRMQRKDFHGIRVAAVDDFQGEENEIIILSLVRSFSSNPSHNSIGFLNIENRVCVSLSRAKKGLYIIGNGYLLKEKCDTKWPEIISYLEEIGCYGTELRLYCQNHPEEETIIRNPKDFNNCPEGGCQKKCTKRLQCGHVCPRVCHINELLHKSIPCSEICNKQLACGHFCKSRCIQCMKNGQCKPCTNKVEKALHCGHTATAVCSQREIQCPMPCSRYLPCKHQCQNLCSQPCTSKCLCKVKKMFPCGHENEASCFQTPNESLCSHKCGAVLECGDLCGGTCGRCKQGRLHVQCRVKCNRTLLCGHNCDFPCPSVCPPCSKPCSRSCEHSQCTRKCYEPCTPCKLPCKWKCPHLKCSEPCGLLCNRIRCNYPCSKTLGCGHPCVGVCGEKCPDKCRICQKYEFAQFENVKDTCFVQLEDCKHIIDVGYLDQLMPENFSFSSTSKKVEFISCPKCGVPIRKSQRYGNYIKTVLIAINAVKKKQPGSFNLQGTLRKSFEAIQQNEDIKFIFSEFEGIKKEIFGTNSQIEAFRAQTIIFQLSYLPEILFLKNILRECEQNQVQIASYSIKEAKNDLKDLKAFLMQGYLSAQQQSDAVFELRRLSCLFKYLDIYCKWKISYLLKPVQSPVDRAIAALTQRVPPIVKVDVADEERYMNDIKRICHLYRINGYSSKEGIDTKAAVGQAKTWRK